MPLHLLRSSRVACSFCISRVASQRVFYLAKGSSSAMRLGPPANADEGIGVHGYGSEGRSSSACQQRKKTLHW